MLGTLSTLSYRLFCDSELAAVVLKSAVILLFCAFIRRFFPSVPDRTKELPELPHYSFLKRTAVRFRPSANELTILLAVTLLYGAISFHRLGSTVLPHTTWQPVRTPQETVLELYEDTVFDRIMVLAAEGSNNTRSDGYQFGLHEFSIDVSDDMVNWENAAVLNEQRFCQYIDTYGWWDKRYIRLTSVNDADAVTEIAFINSAEQRVLPVRVISDGGADSPYPAERMIDEQDVIAVDNTYFDEAFFDEVYHPRNAQEIAEGEYMYSSVHPLLGTELIALSIRLFGMNPFAWRLPGAAFGTLLIPLLWYLIRILSGRTEPALLGAALLGTDFMHITTSRIATLEPMSVFFILLMFIFMTRWCLTSFFDRPLSVPLRELLLCGVMTGLGIAVKWTACYSAAGLAVIYFWSLIRRYREYSRIMAGPAADALTEEERKIRARAEEYPRDAAKTILWSFLFFIAIPLVIYFLAYIPCHITRDGWSLKAVADQIQYMYSYHINLDATHPYQSTWNQWLLDERPVWYYSRQDLSGMYHTIACFTNPVLSYTGLIAILYVFIEAVRTSEPAPVVIAVGYISALAPWLMVGRCVFAYHFYPTSFFMIAAIAWTVCRLAAHFPRMKAVPVIVLILAVLAFVIWLPVLTGFGTTYDYVHFLEIFPSWYFG